MTRLAPLAPDQMTDEQRRLLDAITAASGSLGGPYWAYLRNPDYLRLHDALRNYLRSTRLSGRERQIVILVTVRHWDAEFSWAAQANAAMREGLDAEIIEAINCGRVPDLESPRERCAYRVTKSLLEDHRLSDETYATAASLFGVETLTDIVATLGFYSMVACTANAFAFASPAAARSRLAGRAGSHPE